MRSDEGKGFSQRRLKKKNVEPKEQKPLRRRSSLTNKG